MTDNEIIKALEGCGRKHNEENDTYCEECQFKSYLSCVAFLCDRTIDLINRQKEKNESLKVDLAKCSIRLDNLYKTADEIKSEAIKEFAERLKETITNAINTYYNSNGGGYYLAEDTIEDIDNLAKEMTEVKK